MVTAHTGVDESMTDIHKKESKPLFKPCKDVNYINGSPVNTDKLSERYNQSRFKK